MKLQSQVFTSSGTWTPPTGCTAAWLQMIAGGRAGVTGGTLSGGGGTAESCDRVMIPASTPVTITIGAGGVGNNGVGTDTSAGPFVVRTPAFDVGGETIWGAQGGGVGGAPSNSGTPGQIGQQGNAETNTFFGGRSGAAGSAGGGGGGNGAASPGTTGIGAGGGANPTGAGGGSSTYWGAGGNGGDGSINGTNGVGYGSGGGGASNGHTCGNGMGGYAVVFFIA